MCEVILARIDRMENRSQSVEDASVAVTSDEIVSVRTISVRTISMFMRTPI